MIMSLHAGLGAVLDEGLDAVRARHQAAGDAVKIGMQRLGFELFAAEGHRLAPLSSIMIPEGRLGDQSEAQVRSRLLAEYGIEIGGGLGPVAGKVWRVGTMGHTARLRNVTTLLAALSAIVDLVSARRGGSDSLFGDVPIGNEPVNHRIVETRAGEDRAGVFADSWR